MKLISVKIERFKNIVASQTILIEEDVTGLIGKNESGKTTILRALYRLNPANPGDAAFNLVTEYPRWRLSRDRRREQLNDVNVVTGYFALSDEEIEEISAVLPSRLLPGTTCVVARTYDNRQRIWFECKLRDAIAAAGTEAGVEPADLAELQACDSVEDASDRTKALVRGLRNGGASLRVKALNAFPDALARQAHLPLPDQAHQVVQSRLPKFFYFSSYDLLPGEADLTELARKASAGETLTAGERTMVALLTRAGETPGDFMDEDYESRQAELQAAGADLTRHVFEYWKQNTDLQVIFNTDLVPVGQDPQGRPMHHRLLKVELRDARHGGVETNFSTRSSGFQWFFSFFAAFSEYQDSPEPIIVLLDEPGMSLHGEAQKDFLRFVFDELGASKQTLYTTHSRYMVDPARYEKFRAVHDRATREQPDLGVVVGPVDLSADRDTVLPLESALGDSISQHLFLGGGHLLAVEGSSDFVYLQRMTEYMQAHGIPGLDPRLAMIPVGGADNMPAFVALFSRRFHVTSLIDGVRTQRTLQRVAEAAKHNGVSESAIVVCSEVVDGLPSTADIEDLFDSIDYLNLYNYAFLSNVKPDDLSSTNEPILKRIEVIKAKFDHARPAHALTEHREEFFETISATTTERFRALFERLNATIETS